MTQTIAIFVDAYRNLNSKKMFWVVLAISLLVAGVFALVGIDENGMSILTWHVNSDLLNTNIIPASLFYKSLFLYLGMDIWFTWLATILAIISTSGIFPDLINSRSVDLLVARPISRLRLFVLQYVAGMLFVALQVFLFTLACFLVLGLRGGAWEPGMFMAVPLVVVFFSYLFSVCVFLGVKTRSTMAALLLTMLFWGAIWGIDKAETLLLMAVSMEEEDITWEQLQNNRHNNRRSAPPEPAPKQDVLSSDSSEQKEPDVADAVGKSFVAEDEEPQPEQADEGISAWQIAHGIVYGMKTILPKTSATMDLLDQCVLDKSEMPEMGEGRNDQERVARRMHDTINARSISWKIGTSLLFELAVLIAAAWMFCRRDY